MHRVTRTYLLAGTISILVCIPDAAAGWVCIKNETKVTVLVQEVITPPTGKRGKSVRLLPGEVYREYHATAGEKTVQVLDGRSPTKVLCEAKIKWPAEDVSLRIRTDGKATKVEPTPPAKVGAAQAAVTEVTKAQ